MKLFGILASVGLAANHEHHETPANADFVSVYDAHDTVSNIAKSLFEDMSKKITYIWDKPRIKLLERQLNGKIIRASKKALANNPGSSGSKKRKCAKSEKNSVSDVTSKIITILQRRFDGKRAGFSEAMVSLNFYSRIVCRIM